MGRDGFNLGRRDENYITVRKRGRASEVKAKKGGGGERGGGGRGVLLEER